MILKNTVWAHAALLALVLAVTFSNALHSSLKMDDHDFFNDPRISNPEYLAYNLIPESNKSLAITKAVEESGYRPVTNTALALVHQVFGAHIELYHIVNILVFYGGCLLLYYLIRLLFSDSRLALITSLLFAVHPVNGLAVNYIVASAYAYQLVFAMMSMIFFVRYCRGTQDGFSLVLGLVFLLFALGVHETSIVIPVLMLAVAWYLNPGSILTGVKKAVPFFALLAGYMLFRMKYASLASGVLSKYADFHMSVDQYAASFVKLIYWYLSQLVLPDGIVLMWSTPIVDHDRWVWLGAGILLAVLCIWFLRKSGRSAQSLALVWFIAGFLPVLAACLFRPTTGLVMEPHWMFISSIGIFLFFALILVRLIQWRLWIGLALCVGLFTVLIRISHIYNDLWADEKIYSQYWLEQVPDFKTANFFLAYAFMRDREYPQARQYLLGAREGIFSDWQIYNNLGIMDNDEQQYENAVLNYQKALTFNPSSAEVYNNLGLTYEYLGRTDEAVAANQRALSLNRFLIEPRLNLARIALSRGDPKTAVQLYSENLKIVPYELRSFALLWSALVDAGQLEPAEKMVADLRRRRPDAVILTEIANMAVEKKMLVEALDLYMQAIQSNPRYKPVYVQSGILLANLNHLDRAIGLWQKALALDPSDRQVVRLIARARELQAGLNTNAADKPISNNGEKQ